MRRRVKQFPLAFYKATPSSKNMNLRWVKPVTMGAASPFGILQSNSIVFVLGIRISWLDVQIEKRQSIGY